MVVELSLKVPPCQRFSLQTCRKQRKDDCNRLCTSLRPIITDQIMQMRGLIFRKAFADTRWVCLIFAIQRSVRQHQVKHHLLSLEMARVLFIFVSFRINRKFFLPVTDSCNFQQWCHKSTRLMAFEHFMLF